MRAAFDTVAPDFVLHLAAETSLEASDDDPDHAYLTNTIATRYIALECRNRDVPMTFISTAGVFDGTKDSGPYTEFDAPNPINTYGATKFEAEKLVAGILEKYYIIRAGWMVGGGADKDHKFVARILSQVREGRTTIHAVGDKFGTPTYTYDFAHCLLGLMHSEVYGLYHMVCGGDGSRYDVAARILEVLGRDDIELVEVDSEFFAEEFPSEPAPLRDHAEHGPRPAGHEHHAALARGPGRVPREPLRRPADLGRHERLTPDRTEPHEPTTTPRKRRGATDARGPEPGQPAARR